MQRKTLLPLPPLSFEVLCKVHDLEEYVRLALDACSDPESMSFNTEYAIRLLRTCVVTMLDMQINYYSSLSHYQPEWIDEIEHKTINSMIRAFPPFKSGEEFRGELHGTIKDHLAQRPETTTNEAAIAVPPSPDGTDRIALRKGYFAKFPEVKILDICWAAGQHYREWKRWLKNELANGTVPDLAFRRVLSSDKRPEELKNKPRPSGWQ
jgi:hypothetical protein